MSMCLVKLTVLSSGLVSVFSMAAQQHQCACACCPCFRWLWVSLHAMLSAGWVLQYSKCLLYWHSRVCDLGSNHICLLLLHCRCPHTGVRVFRMWRDDSYLQTMLQMLQVLQTECIIPQIQPRTDLYSSIPGYKAFLHRTSAIARAAVCIAAGDEEVVARVPEATDGSNVPKFW